MPTATKASVPTTIARIGISITKACETAAIHATSRGRLRGRRRCPSQKKTSTTGRRSRASSSRGIAWTMRSSALDDRDPDRDRHPALAEPPAEAALAVLDDAWFDHAAKLPSRLPSSQVVQRSANSSRAAAACSSIGEEPVDRRAGSRDVRAESAGGAKLLRERRGGEVVRRQRGEVAGLDGRDELQRAARRSRRSPVNAA